MTSDFEHIQSAHCENGVTTNLLRNIGVSRITEPLAFGIGAGLFFAYIPFLKVNNAPAIAFRVFPGLIFKRTCQYLGVEVVRRRFSSRERAKRYLDEMLEAGRPVGCQVGVYYLPYFPKEYRFHFNAHNVVVYGKDGGDYLVSDPVMEFTTRLSSYELERVRFARGALAPRGQLYYPKRASVVSDERIATAIEKGVKKNISAMIGLSGPIAGVNGIKFLGKRIKKWRDKLGLHRAGLYLAQLVRMQEEIGTGGGGFRYIYGAFLQEAFAYHEKEPLLEISKAFTQAGDLWRTAAVHAAGIYRGRKGEQEDFNVMGDYLLELAEMERQAFVALSRINWHR